MRKLTRLILIAGFCLTLLLMVGVSARIPHAHDVAFLQPATPTEGFCDLSDPIAQSWQLYMSDRPLQIGDSPPEDPPPREVYETGTRRVFAILRTPCGESWPDQLTVSMQIRDDRAGVQYESGPITVGRNQWQSVEWSVPADRSIPSSGSPYQTRLFWVDNPVPSGSPEKEVYWVVGVSVQFDRDAYTGDDDVARLTVNDFGAEPDQETVVARVSSQTDPDGLDVVLNQRAGRGQFETVSGITFDDSCPGGSHDNVLCVTHQDLLSAEYRSQLDPNQVFTDEARWYRPNFTPTPTWPPSPTPGPPTLTPTVGPSPTATPSTPTATPTPTEFPWATIVPLTAVPPGQYDVGSVSSDLPEKNLLGSYAIWAGSHNTNGRQKLYGALHFDLSSIPPSAEITEAWLDIAPYSGSNMHPEFGGLWSLKILDDAVGNPWHGGDQPYYPVYGLMVEDPAMVVPVGTPASPNDLNEDLQNDERTRFTFTEEALDYLETRLGAGEVALRLDGPLMDEFQSFTWHSGYAPESPEDKPVLHLEYKVFGATWTPSPTSPFTATPTYTPTPTLTPTQTGTIQPTPTATATPVPAITFDRAVYYRTDAEALIEVVDLRRDADPSAIDTIDVRVRSETEPSLPNALQLTLTETAVDSGRFTGILKFSTTSSDAAARRIHVSDGDWVEAIFTDLEPAEAHWYAQAPTATPTATPTTTATRTLTPTRTPTATITPTATPPAWVAFDRDRYWSAEDAAVVMVLDPDVNQDPGQREEIPVSVYSETGDPQGIRLFVRETNTDTGIFSSAAGDHNLYFCWLCQESNPEEGMLKVADGDELTVFYDSDHQDCCWDTAHWFLSEVSATGTPTGTPTATRTPTAATPTPTSTGTATPGSSATPTPTRPPAQHRVYLPAVMRR